MQQTMGMQHSMPKAAVIGGGVIGAGWIARFIENGIDVAVYDPDTEAARKIRVVLDNAKRAYSKLTAAPRRTPGTLTLHETLDKAVVDASIIVESVPEHLDIKQAVYAEIESAAPRNALIASSTSGILPSDLQAKMKAPERLLVAHPFNPVYLLPVVELVGGKLTSDETLSRAEVFFQTLGMHPLRVKKEIPAFIADRLLEAVWRESLWLVKDDVATTQDIDDVIRLGFGLRWAQMGLFETYRIAGGEEGMRHFLDQFGPCLQWPWTRLMDVPELDEALIDKIASQSDAQSNALSIRELEQKRDDNLIAIMQALKTNNWGAGRTLAIHEKRLLDDNLLAQQQTSLDSTQLIETVKRNVPDDWTDYNNHMNESRYLQCFSDASDELMRIVGIDADYLERTGSYFTVETHIQHKGEAYAGQTIHVSTQLLTAQGKKLHLFHRLKHEDGRLLATGEHMLIHVSLKTRIATEPDEQVLAKAREIAHEHAKLSRPEGLGRAVGQAPG
jgi:carnitine 3-dehydrogenase